jgi:hypothetical protein
VRRAKALQSKGIHYVDGRLESSGSTSGAHLQSPGTRPRRYSTHAWTGRGCQHSRGWLYTLWPTWCWTFCQNGPQWHRIWPHAGIRRRF